MNSKFNAEINAEINAVIVHGSNASNKGNWFSWLKQELEELSVKVFLPQFPIGENQLLFSWLESFEKQAEKERFELNKNTIFVAHSLGPSFVLSLLESINFQIKACFFVAGFTGKLGIPEFDSIHGTFTEKKFDWSKIKKNCKKFICIGSVDDPYVSIEKAGELALILGAEMIELNNQGHFMFFEFPFLLKKIKEQL